MSLRCWWVIAVAGWLLSGCASIEYYWQSARGHLEVLSASKPIQSVIEDPATTPQLRQRLEDVKQMLRFADQELGLPSQGSYRDYADIGREYVVWTVVAAPRLSLQPKLWCYPVVGCLSYRGFYALSDASHFASQLRQRDYDVYVAPVRAYSTLGWFSDPLLSTLMGGPTWDLAGVIFHELSHQKVYFSGDTSFNEAYAVALQREGVKRWLAQRNETRESEHYRRAGFRREAFMHLVTKYRALLESAYGSKQEPDAKQKMREQIFTDMRSAYSDLKSQWLGYPGYDRWFGQDLNNAKLALAATYNELVPSFSALIKLKQGDLNAFHDAINQLAELTPEKRRTQLNEWLLKAQ